MRTITMKLLLSIYIIIYNVRNVTDLLINILGNTFYSIMLFLNYISSISDLRDIKLINISNQYYSSCYNYYDKIDSM